MSLPLTAGQIRDMWPRLRQTEEKRCPKSWIPLAFRAASRQAEMDCGDRPGSPLRSPALRGGAFTTLVKVPAVSVGDTWVGRIDTERGCQDDQVVLFVKEDIADRLRDRELVQHICLLDAPSIVTDRLRFGLQIEA